MIEAVSHQRPRLTPEARPERLPLSPAQHGLWLAHQLQASPGKYNLSSAWRLRGPLDRSALTAALETIVRRHEILRTRFAEIAGEPVQVIAPAGPVEIPLDDLRDLSESDRGRAVMDALIAEWETPFDLTNGSPLRVRLLRLAETDHVFIRTLHHIVSDGWSNGVFNRELDACYQAARTGAACPLEPLAVQYADVALWQRRWLTGAVLDQGLFYWRQQLEGIPAQLALPADRARSLVERFDGRVIEKPMPADLLSALKRFGQANRASLYMTLLAGFGALLARCSGQDDVVIGSPVVDRPDVRLENMIGLFTNELPMRVRVPPRVTFRQMVGEVGRTAAAAYRHQAVPFEYIVREISALRSRASTPVFQVGFGLQQMSWRLPALAGLEVEPWSRAERLQAKLDLELQVMLDGPGATLVWLYNSELYEPWRIERMAAHYLQLLQAAVQAPDEPVRSASLLDAAERQELEGFHGPVRQLPEVTIPQMFEAQVDRTPDATAVVSGHESLTYAALDAQADRLAGRLHELGVAPDSIVAIYAERSTELVVALLAVLKAGGAYVGIDLSYPRDRAAFMLSDSQAVVVLADRRGREALGPVSRPVVSLEDYGVPASTEANAHPTPKAITARARPDNLAYVIYTSGSTGRPKGVAIAHRALCNHMAWMQDRFPLTESDRVLQRTPISFDASVWEFYAPLLTGATLAMAPPDSHPDGNTLARWICDHGVTVVQMVPSLLRVFTDAAEITRCVGLRRVFCGGEPLLADVQRQFVERLPGVELHNLYGPTETTIDATSWECHTGDPSAPPSIGRPIWNTRAYVLDRDLAPVPVGVTGELYIGGAALGRGYLRRSALTAERFVPDPRSAGGARMYRTGDLARWRRDGALDLLGRVDHQVKIRGFRIEPGEIESALRSTPGVAQALIVVREDEVEQTRLVGYVVPEHGAVVDLERAREKLRETLPEWMIPAAIMQLDAMPLLPNGKIDRHSLPAPDRERPAGYRAPRSSSEQTLCAIFAEVLGVERVGIDDDFFDLGGHSLSAMRAIMRSRSQLGLELSFRTLLEKGTVSAIVDQLAHTAPRQVEAG